MLIPSDTYIKTLLDLKQVEEAVERVRNLHMESNGKCLQCTEAETGGDEFWIEWHSVDYPCPTIRALDAPSN
jgi:hypothetical protein